MPSLPETPPDRDPRTDSECRFHDMGTPCESGESYHPGGYHPVHIHEVFNDRYAVIRKLGYGSYSTVWLVNDLQTSHYAALKIVVAKADQQQAASRELLIQDCLIARGTYFQHIVQLLDFFNHRGPNGVHLCLVYEVMGPNVDSMLYLSSQCQIGEHWERRLPKNWAKRILRDTLCGLQFLHANGFVHGDIHPGNILFTIKPTCSDSDSLERLEQHPTKYDLLERLDGKIDLWAPRYLLEAKPLYEYTSLELYPLVKIGDLGGGFSEGSTPSSIVIPTGFRAPEMILKGQLGTSLDIWSFGCLIFNLITNCPLFRVERLDGTQLDEMTNDTHLIQITERIQPLPTALFDKWSRARFYYGPETERLTDAQSEDCLDYLKHIDNLETLETRFRAKKPADIDEKEEEEIVSLMRLALQLEPAIRATAAQLLQHSWFQE